MKITFVNKSTKQPQEFQEDYVIDSEGRVFKWCDIDFRGYGCWRVTDTYIGVICTEENGMTEVKISEVLHLAADKYLAEDWEYDWVLQDEFSCIAITMAVKELIPSRKIADSFYNRIRIDLEEMGIDTYRGSQFDEFCGDCLAITKESQGARYTWLKFAAMIAEEQGV